MPNTLRLSKLQAEARKVNLNVVQVAYPPGGYNLEFPNLRTTVVGVDRNKYDRAPAIWCRNLVEVESAIANRPRVSKRKP